MSCMCGADDCPSCGGAEERPERCGCGVFVTVGPNPGDTNAEGGFRDRDGNVWCREQPAIEQPAEEADLDDWCSYMGAYSDWKE